MIGPVQAIDSYQDMLSLARLVSVRSLPWCPADFGVANRKESCFTSHVGFFDCPWSHELRQEHAQVFDDARGGMQNLL